MRLNELFIHQGNEILNEKLIVVGGGKKYGQVVFLAGGAGCLARDTEILMFDGTKKKVQDIKEGDLLMGPDSRPRTVVETVSGKEPMLHVKMKKGNSYVSNRSHIHSFVCSFNKCGLKKGQIYNLTYDEFLSLPISAQKALLLYKTDIEYPEKPVPIDPYILGLWLGDGVRTNTNIIVDNKNDVIVNYVSESLRKEGKIFNKLKTDKVNCSVYSVVNAPEDQSRSNPNIYRDYFKEKCVINEEKRIPFEYLINSKEIRKKVLAGLIDSDGHNAGNYIEIVTVFDGLKDDIYDLCSSLGYNVTITNKKALWNGEEKNYHRIFISGDLSDVPVLLDYKRCYPRKQIKNPIRYGFEFEELPENEFFGFKLAEEDKRFLLGNYVVTHNSGKGFTINQFLEGDKFKVRDVDAWKEIFLELAKTKKKYKELKDLDLRNPKDVFKLHSFVKEKGIKEKSLDLLLADTKEGRLPNIIFDITMKDMDELKTVVPRLIDLGYDEKNIHIVWVLTNYRVAVVRNSERDRVVPEDILIQTHEGAANTMYELVTGKLPKGVDGSVHVILNNKENTIFYKNPDGSVYRDSKGRTVIKDFSYLTVKKPGKKIDPESSVQKKLLKWIRDNVPKTKKTAHLF